MATQRPFCWRRKMPSPGDAGYGIWLGNFYCGVRSMAPWLPWQEGVTLAAAFGFTENVCFECADTWLQLDALEFDPPRRSGDGSGRADVQRIRLLYKPDLHGDDGLVIVSSDEEDVISPQHAPPDVCRRWRSGALEPHCGCWSWPCIAAGAGWAKCSSLACLLAPVQSSWSRTPAWKLPPDIPLWAWELFSKPRFHWTEARVQALQESCLQTLQAADRKLSVPD